MSVLPAATNYNVANSFFALAGSGGGGGTSTTSTVLVPRGYLSLNSEDRYQGGTIQRDPTLQTSPTNITYNIPKLSSITTLQLTNFQATNGQWDNYIRDEYYNNVIDVIDYNIPSTFRVTIPAPIPITVLNNALEIYVTPQLGDLKYTGGSFPTFSIVTTNSLYPISQIDNYQGAAYYGCLTWVTSNIYSNLSTFQAIDPTISNHNWGFAPVSSIRGVNVAGYTQLYDLLGLQGHVSSVGAINTVLARGNTFTLGGKVGYATRPVSDNWCKYIDFCSPQFVNGLDASSTCNAPPGLFARIQPTVKTFTAGSIGISTGTAAILTPLQNPKVLSLASNTSSLTIQMYTDRGNPLPLGISTITPSVVMPISSMNFLTSTAVFYTSTNFFAPSFVSTGSRVTCSNTYGTYPFYANAPAGTGAGFYLPYIMSVSSTGVNSCITIPAPGISTGTSNFVNVSVKGDNYASTILFAMPPPQSVGNTNNLEYVAQFVVLSNA